MQTRYFPRYPNYKNASINMFNAGYPADKARPSPCGLSGWPARCSALPCAKGGACRCAGGAAGTGPGHGVCFQPAAALTSGTAWRAAEHQRGRDVVQQVREAAHPGARGALQLHLRCAPAPDPGPDQQSARLPQLHARALAFPQARGACKPRRCPWPTARPARRADTDNGNSGGPVWVAQDGKRYLIGIHVAGGTDLNYGTRISTRVEAFIVNAMAKGG